MNSRSVQSSSTKSPPYSFPPTAETRCRSIFISVFLRSFPAARSEYELNPSSAVGASAASLATVSQASIQSEYTSTPAERSMLLSISPQASSMGEWIYGVSTHNLYQSEIADRRPCRRGPQFQPFCQASLTQTFRDYRRDRENLWGEALSR